MKLYPVSMKRINYDNCDEEQQISDILELDGGMNIDKAHIMARKIINKIINNK